MKNIRLITAGVILTSGVLTLSPLTAAAESTAASPVGTAQASTLQVSLAPSTLMAVLPGAASALHGVLGSALGGADLTARVGAAQAAGTLSSGVADLQHGHAESTPLAVDLSTVERQVNALQHLAAGAASAIQGLQQPGGVGSVAGGAGALTGLLGNSALGGRLLPQLAGLPQVLASVGNALDGIASGGALSGVLHGLDPKLANTVTAKYRIPGFADAPLAQASLADLNMPPASPLHVDVAPFHARAVTASLASANGIAGPQASADNHVSSLSVAPQLNTPSLGAAKGALDGLHGLLGTLLDTSSGLPAVGSLLSGLVAAPGTETLSTALQGLVGGSTSPLGGRLTGNGLFGSILSGSPTPALGSLTGTSTVTQAAPILGAQDAGGPTQLVQGLTGRLTDLNALLGADSPLGALLGGRLSLNSLVSTTDLASTAVVQPASGGTIQALATSTAADVQLLPLGDVLGGALAHGVLGDPTTILGGRANLAPGLPLLDIKGISSSAQAVLGPGAGAPVGSSSVKEIDVLGVPVVTLDQVRNIPLGSASAIPLPGTGLELMVSRGLPAIGFDTATRKSVSVAALNVRLLSDGTGALGTLLAGEPPAGGTTGKTVAEVALGNAAADVSATPVTPSAPLHMTAAQGPISPSTGMFGPSAAAAVGIVAALAVLLRTVPGLLTRGRAVR